MATKALLVTMAGYPMAPSNFMPDNGLAQLAACLINNGHDAMVVDLNTPELMDRLLPESIGEILAALSEEKLSCYGRIGNARNTDFSLYRKAGCRALFFGVETGSQLILDQTIHKGYQTNHCAEILKACKNAGIYTITSIIYPNPGETDESRRITLKLLEETKPMGCPVHVPLLLPGSQWWDSPEKYGFTVPNRATYLKKMVSYKARLLFPPQYWPEMGYQIDHKQFNEFSEETMDFTKTVEAMGITTLVSDDVALLGILSGLSVKKFRDTVRTAMVSGDAEGLYDLIERINSGMIKNRSPEESPLTYPKSSTSKGESTSKSA